MLEGLNSRFEMIAESLELKIKINKDYPVWKTGKKRERETWTEAQRPGTTETILSYAQWDS